MPPTISRLQAYIGVLHSPPLNRVNKRLLTSSNAIMLRRVVLARTGVASKRIARITYAHVFSASTIFFYISLTRFLFFSLILSLPVPLYKYCCSVSHFNSKHAIAAEARATATVAIVLYTVVNARIYQGIAEERIR